MTNVLVFPCGSEIGLEIHRALRHSIHFNLYGGSSVNDHGKFVYGNYAELPMVDAPEFTGELNRIIHLNNIDFVIPAHDSVVLKLAEHQNSIAAEVVTSSAETCRICRSKLNTYRHFDGVVNTPAIYGPQDEKAYPVFLKPDRGQGSKGVHKVTTDQELDFFTRKDPTLIALEYLPGREYTIDCFTDRNSQLLFAGGRERVRISNGISVNSVEVADTRFHNIAATINKHLSLRGAWFFQVKERADGTLVLMEIAPRIAGTMALFRVHGVNFVQLSLFDRMGLDVSVLRNDSVRIEIDRALCARYLLQFDYQYVYVDFDDTIIVDGAVNSDLIKFLYQVRNANKHIILLTRHKRDIHESLNTFAISELLFEQIIVVEPGRSKADYITNDASIFIDDSFAERKNVHDARHIPVFALDAVEALASC